MESLTVHTFSNTSIIYRFLRAEVLSCVCVCMYIPLTLIILNHLVGHFSKPHTEINSAINGKTSNTVFCGQTNVKLLPQESVKIL